MKLKFEKMCEGLHWVYTSDDGEELSIICHNGSYGWKQGEFETRCSWLSGVQSHLTFGQVQQKINTIHERELRSNKCWKEFLGDVK